MEFSQEAIEEYKQLYKKEFGKDITDEEAREQLTNLIELVGLLVRPTNQNKNQFSEEGKNQYQK